jgi:hypothetical protein
MLVAKTLQKQKEKTMNVITIELSAQDRAKLDTIAESLAVLINHLSVSVQLQAAKVECAPAPAVDPDAESVKVPEPSAPTVEDPEPMKAAASVVGLAEFQKALTLRCTESAETKARVRALLNEYAAAASAVPEEKRSEILDRLAAL